MARIVGSDGREIGPAEVAAIECSIYSIDSLGRFRTAVIGQLAVPLDVRDVIFDSLQTDGLWTVDDVGYNFRHEVALGESTIVSRAEGHIEVEYLLTPIKGTKTRVRFQLKVI